MATVAIAVCLSVGSSILGLPPQLEEKALIAPPTLIAPPALIGPPTLGRVEEVGVEEEVAFLAEDGEQEMTPA